MSKIKNELKNDPLMPLRHTAEHVLQAAMEELYPDIKKVMGPPIEDGFYFDFDLDTNISLEDFPKIEEKMQEIINANLPVTGKEITVEDARELFKGNKYKQELIDEIEQRGEKASIYEIGSRDGKHYFVDLCGGPHVSRTGEVKTFKLLSVAGAYWRGEEKNKMLQRIYGTAYLKVEDLNNRLDQLEQAKLRDHRIMGKRLDLFTFSDLIGSGLPLYTPKGTLIRNLLTGYVESLQTKKGYQQVWTPQLAKAALFKMSGHYDKYKANMFHVKSNYSDEEFFLKPMNCPQHTQIYSSQPRSYRDLPLRFADFAMLYRDEKPGELSGLARTRSFSQDDCHIFCREDQVDAEIDVALAMTKEIMQTFGLKYKYRLSTRDPNNFDKYLGDPETWSKVEKWAEKIMERNHIDFIQGPGEAAFYAPKMDLIATDALGREWQLSTVQIDFVLPERFGLTYTDQDGKDKRPVMIHRAIIGSPERFIMILLEHFGGALPVWLSPVQATIIPIGEKHKEYAEKVAQTLREADIRLNLDDRDEMMQAKIRNAQLQKVPYMLVVGDREAENSTVAVRLRTGENLGAIYLEEAKAKISDKYLTKALDLW